MGNGEGNYMALSDEQRRLSRGGHGRRKSSQIMQDILMEYITVEYTDPKTQLTCRLTQEFYPLEKKATINITS